MHALRDSVRASVGSVPRFGQPRGTRTLVVSGLVRGGSWDPRHIRCSPVGATKLSNSCINFTGVALLKVQWTGRQGARSPSQVPHVEFAQLEPESEPVHRRVGDGVSDNFLWRATCGSCGAEQSRNSEVAEHGSDGDGVGPVQDVEQEKKNSDSRSPLWPLGWLPLRECKIRTSRAVARRRKRTPSFDLNPSPFSFHLSLYILPQPTAEKVFFVHGLLFTEQVSAPPSSNILFFCDVP